MAASSTASWCTARNLADCHAPLFDLIDGVSRNGAKTADVNYGRRGRALVLRAPLGVLRLQRRPGLPARRRIPAMKGSAEFCLDCPRVSSPSKSENSANLHGWPYTGWGRAWAINLFGPAAGWREDLGIHLHAVAARRRPQSLRHAPIRQLLGLPDRWQFRRRCHDPPAGRV